MRVLLTGGAGYIGTHTAVELLNNEHEVIVVDNLANSSVEAIRRVERLTNKQIQFHETDLLDYSSLEKVLQIEKPDAVIHFAGLKAVGESVAKPLQYYQTNLLTVGFWFPPHPDIKVPAQLLVSDRRGWF